MKRPAPTTGRLYPTSSPLSWRPTPRMTLSALASKMNMPVTFMPGGTTMSMRQIEDQSADGVADDCAGETETNQDDDGASASDGNGRDRRAGNYPHGDRRAGHRIAIYLYRNHLGGNHTKVEKRRLTAARRAQYPQSFWVQGHWVSQKPKGWLKVPYRLPEMLAALAKDPTTDVYSPEGEKDCETLIGLN